MRRPKVKKAEFEERLDAEVGSVNRLHAGYPTTHRRIRKTTSKFIVNVLEKHSRSGTRRELTEGERTARDEAQAMFTGTSRRK